MKIEFSNKVNCLIHRSKTKKLLQPYKNIDFIFIYDEKLKKTAILKMCRKSCVIALQTFQIGYLFKYLKMKYS